MDKGKIILNAKQREAVEHGAGPILIVAGAGTGKTTVVTERIKHLILARRAKPSEILALTFTEKAAHEMEQRVDTIMPYGYTQMWISTFHAFCDRILRQVALQIGLDPKFKLLTESEAIQFIRTNLFRFALDYFRPLGNPTKFVGGLLQHFQRLKDEDVSPREYTRFAQKLMAKRKRGKDEDIEAAKTLELARAYQTYEELKTKEGLLDFSDLIGKTLELFRRRPNILQAYRRQFRYVLVDEFQDTNIAQYELVKLLAPPGKKTNLAVVGDDAQSIFKFRGAAVSNILHFMDEYRGAKMLVLTQNYRSTQSILDQAYRLISHNNPDTLEVKLGIEKNLVSIRQPQGGSPVEFIHRDRVENEAEAVAKRVSQLVLEEDYQYKDVAILVRANNHAEPFIRALMRRGVPYQFLGPGRLFRQPEVIDLIAYLRVLKDFEDDVALYRLFSMEEIDIPPKDLVRIQNQARRHNLPLFEACEQLKGIRVAPETKQRIGIIIKLVERHLKRLTRETAGQLLYDFLRELGLLERLLNPKSADAEQKAANIAKLFDKLKTYEAEHQDASVPAVVDWIELASELGESPLAADIDWTEVNAVNLLTCHSAKGLEFPVVFLVNLVSERFPTRERREQIPIPETLIKEVLPSGDYHEQEERRLFYVGMTRARERLFLTAADYYGEGRRVKKLSPFIFEALGDNLAAAERQLEDRQLSFLDFAPSQMQSESQAARSQPEPTHIDYLSYSQIETFKTCPLHFKLKNLLRIPTPPSAAQSFGMAIHAALNDLYNAAKQGKRVTRRLTEKLLVANWIPAGYANRAHEQRMYEKGKTSLETFITKEYKPKELPIALEQPFVVPLTPAIQGERPLRVGGKIDRVDQLPEGKIKIIDYKTGANLPAQKEVDRDLQLTIYALAATEINEPPFGKNAEEVILSLYYLDTQSWMTTTRTPQQLAKAKQELFSWRKKIEASDFSCSGNRLCDRCEYHLFCRER